MEEEEEVHDEERTGRHSGKAFGEKTLQPMERKGREGFVQCVGFAVFSQILKVCWDSDGRRLRLL